MKKLLIVAAILACSPAFADPVVVDIRACAHGYDTHPDSQFSTTGNYYINVWNNTDIPQTISIVYDHCVDAGGCVSGQDVHVVDPKSLWSHEYSLTLTGVHYGAGLYSNWVSMDVRVDSTGQHYRQYNKEFIRSS